MAKETDFATLSAQIAAAMVSALDARPRSRSDFEQPVTVTVGAVMSTGNGIPTVVDPFGTETPTGDLAPRSRTRPLPRSEISGLTRRAPLSRTNVGRLNDEISKDIPKCLGLLHTLAKDPDSWNDLFELDEHLQDSLRRLDPKVTKAFVNLVGKLELFRNELTSLTFEISPPAHSKKRDGPWYEPDKFEVGLKGGVGYESGAQSHTTTEVGLEAKVVWEF